MLNDDLRACTDKAEASYIVEKLLYSIWSGDKADAVRAAQKLLRLLQAITAREKADAARVFDELLQKVRGSGA